MATKKAADHTLYHLSSKGFWKKFRDVIAVNPEISSGLPLQSVNRQPPPGSRTELYSTPATLASDLAQNPYWKRDVRRMYPQLSVVTQSQMAQILVASPEYQAIAPPLPKNDAKEGPSDLPAQVAAQTNLTQAISTLYTAKKAYSTSNLPPRPISGPTQWKPQRSSDAPHDKTHYWPMLLYK